MEAEYYSDKSIAVFGETREWAGNLSALGGRFNKNLEGGPGWVFSRAKEPELMQFIAESKAGLVDPIAPKPAYARRMLPHAALRKSKDAQTTIPPVPKPMTPLQTQPAVLNFPNLFTAADGLSYQVVIYTVPCPKVGQDVTLTVGENSDEYQVSSIHNSAPPFDSFSIVKKNAVEPTYQAVLMKGEWKIQFMQEEHKLTFHPSV